MYTYITTYIVHVPRPWLAWNGGSWAERVKEDCWSGLLTVRELLSRVGGVFCVCVCVSGGFSVVCVCVGDMCGV